MMYVSDLNLQNARTITKEFDQAVASLDWCVRMTIEGIKTKLNWPWYGFEKKDQLVQNLSWIFNHVVDPMLAERERFDFKELWDGQLFEDPVDGFYNYDDLLQYRHQWSFQTGHTDFRMGDLSY